MHIGPHEKVCRCLPRQRYFGYRGLLPTLDLSFPNITAEKDAKRLVLGVIAHSDIEAGTPNLSQSSRCSGQALSIHWYASAQIFYKVH